MMNATRKQWVKRNGKYLIITLMIFSAILSSCEQQQEHNQEGHVLRQMMMSQVLEDSIAYQIYYPPQYGAQDTFHLLYLLHGHGGSDDDWITGEEGDVQAILDSLIMNDIISPCVAVTFDAGNSWYVNRHRQMEKFFIEEWVSFVSDTLFHDITFQRRIIAGNSAGGFGALRLSLLHPELVEASILLSPAAYNPSPPGISSSRKIDVFSDEEGFSDEIWQSYSYLNISLDTTRMNVYPEFYISTGDDDAYEIVDVVVQLREYLSSLGIQQELTIIDGGHTWEVWRDRFAFDLVHALGD